MKNTYTMAVVAKCPKGGRDEYRLTVQFEAIIEVETIIEVVELCTREPIFQEGLTKAIAEGLDERTDGRVNGYEGTVVLEGVHSGVVVRSEEIFGV